MAALSAMGIDVYSRHTQTLPSFIMPFTNPKHDVDVSGQMHVNGHIEIGLTQVLLRSPTESPCERALKGIFTDRPMACNVYYASCGKQGCLSIHPSS